MNILACPPVLKSKQLEIGIVDFTPGPGCLQAVCQKCATPVYIGVKQREHLAKHPQTPVLCPMCVAGLIDKSWTVKHCGGIGSTYLVK